jgi:hypothetical protein
MRSNRIGYAALLLVMTALALPCAGQQHENPMLCLKVPSGLENRQMYVGIGHAMYRMLDHYPRNDFFAVLNGGANLNLSLRLMVAAGFEVNAGYTSLAREKTLGLSKTFPLLGGKILTQLDVQFFNYDDFIHNNVDQNFFYALSLQTLPLFDDRLIATADVAYDGYNESVGTGFGLSWAVLKKVSLIGEFYPLSQTTETADRGCYAAGFKIATYGHHFLFRISNTVEMGTRRYMAGTNANHLYLGFTIMRMISR